MNAQLTGRAHLDAMATADNVSDDERVAVQGALNALRAIEAYAIVGESGGSADHRVALAMLDVRVKDGVHRASDDLRSRIVATNHADFVNGHKHEDGALELLLRAWGRWMRALGVRT